ncbi:thioredoxin family protein [Galbibacter sp. PAP.153]|uniref:thioredoxin family protein n=1 Tax=Galbibacter sp. PAP.153 TaxID=3104623 RepID=UPI00300B4131
MKFFSILFLAISLLQAETSPSVNWLTDYPEAKAIAKQEKKNILMYFTGSDWCGPCKMLK